MICYNALTLFIHTGHNKVLVESLKLISRVTCPPPGSCYEFHCSIAIRVSVITLKLLQTIIIVYLQIIRCPPSSADVQHVRECFAKTFPNVLRSELRLRQLFDHLSALKVGISLVLRQLLSRDYVGGHHCGDYILSFPSDLRSRSDPESLLLYEK